MRQCFDQNFPDGGVSGIQKRLKQSFRHVASKKRFQARGVGHLIRFRRVHKANVEFMDRSDVVDMGV